MIEGRLSIDEAARYIRRMPTPEKQRKKDAVRYFHVERLIANDYYILRTPTAGIPPHVSVYGDMTAISADSSQPGRELVDIEAHRRWWGRPGRVRLESLEIERRGRDDGE